MAASDCLVVLDTAYGDSLAVTAAVIFEDWTSSKPLKVVTDLTSVSEEYIPGQFYRRELPCIQSALKLVSVAGFLPKVIIVDGYVTLSKGKGLGHHLFDALGVPVVGVAKNKMALSADCAVVLRGSSLKPLYITAMGLNLDHAAELVEGMHGDHRIPTLLKLADRECRDDLKNVEANA